MRYSKAAILTLKEAPSDADSINAVYLIRGGFIKRELAGVYTHLPLGKRVLQKIEKIIREEMTGIDSVEVGMPALTPIENWVKTGRDKADIAYHPTEQTVLGWSHEEIVTPLAKMYIRSFKDLPLSLFQIQTKFRNEARAKSGILRGREFSMKDMYSFHATQKDLDEYYNRTLHAYFRVFERCGLTSFAIEASGGIFTKKVSHEFAVITDAGEDIVIFEESSGGLKDPQNAEIAVGNPPESESFLKKSIEAEKPMEEKPVKRPNTITGTAKALGIEEWDVLKSVVFAVKKGKKPELHGISLRGDLEVNMAKVYSFFQTEDVKSATSEELKALGLVEGYISPVKNSAIPFYADHSVAKMRNFNTGANKFGVDVFNVNADRDCVFKSTGDFVLVKEGFTSVKTGNVLTAAKCVEVGNIFDLGTKYSDAFNVTFTDADGEAKPVLMGCYGIGVSRLMGTIVETFHDDKGILWPKPVAPYHVVLIPLGKKDTDEFNESLRIAEKMENELEEKGIEVILDDREASPGIKFADADLTGIPLRIVVSPRTLEKKCVEWKERKEEKSVEVPLTEAVKKIEAWMKS